MGGMRIAGIPNAYLLEKTKTRVNELCSQDKKRNLERWSHELQASSKNQGNRLAHKQSKPQSNPFLNKAKVPETIHACRTRIATKGPPMCQIVKQERHQLHHLALPTDMHWRAMWTRSSRFSAKDFFGQNFGKVTRRQAESWWTSHPRMSGAFSRHDF